MTNLNPTSRIIFALIGGILTFALSTVLGIHFWAAVVFGVLMCIVLWAVLPYFFMSHATSAQPAAPQAAAMNGATADPVMAAPPMAAADAKPAPMTAPAEVVTAAPVMEKAKAEKPAPKAEKAPVAKAAAKDDAVAGAIGTAPAILSAPRDGKADDLKIIEGVGPALEKLVNSLGFYHFDQIANWSDAEIMWVDSHMKTFKGRIVRDKWHAQAKLILSEGIAAFRERAKTNNY